MSKDKKKGKGKDGKSGGFGKAFLMMTALIGAGCAAFWFFAPDQFQTQVDNLKSLLGM